MRVALVSTSVTDTRERILQAAVRVLAARGQAALTVRAVAQEVGSSTTGIYTWFGSKEGLLEAIYVDGFRRFHAYVGRPGADDLNDPDRARAGLERMAYRYWEWALDNPTHYVLMFAGVPTHFTPSPEARMEAASGFGDLVSRVRAAMDPGSREDDVVLAAYRVWATLHGYVMLQVGGPEGGGSVARARFRDGVRMVLASLG